MRVGLWSRPKQDPKVSPPLEMAKKGHKELLRVMSLAVMRFAR